VAVESGSDQAQHLPPADTSESRAALAEASAAGVEDLSYQKRK